MERERIWVYGTLRRGASNAFRLAEGCYVDTGRVRGRLYRIDWYPGVCLDAVGSEVVGEVFEVSAAVLRALDAFEGLPPGELEGVEYRRVLARVSLDGGGETEAWVWEWIGPVDEARRVAGGDWLAVGI